MSNAVSNYVHGLVRKVQGQDQVWRGDIDRDRLGIFLTHSPPGSDFDRVWREEYREEYSEDYGTGLGDTTSLSFPYLEVGEQPVSGLERGMNWEEALEDLSQLEERAAWGLTGLTAALYTEDGELYFKAKTRCNIEDDADTDTGVYVLEGELGRASEEVIETVETVLEEGGLEEALQPQ